MAITKAALLKLTVKERLKVLHDMEPTDLNKFIGFNWKLIDQLGTEVRENKTWIRKTFKKDTKRKHV